MHETPADLHRLRQLLDRSLRGAGSHLSSILTPERTLSAHELVRRLTGMCLLVVATATADGRPLTGAVDGIFYRGAFHFGSSDDSVRFRHLRRDPAVSACHLPGEHLAVTVHGRARMIDVASPAHAGFRRAMLEVYAPRYGPAWETDFLDAGPRYARIDADKMFVFADPSLAVGPGA